jgi:hypothetical protein
MDARLSKCLSHRRNHPFQQFGQAYDTLSNNGATGCTDTCLQFIARIWGKSSYTHDQIRRRVGHTNRYTGLNYAEVSAFLKSIGLSYTRHSGSTEISAGQMLTASRRGPVLFGEMYSWHPEWRGYHYAGLTANSTPNGYARPLEKAGKTQLTGFTGRHAGVLLGYDGDNVYVMEPNHNSPSRPENPPYDILTVAQFKALIASFKRATGTTYCFTPNHYLPL